ncbi:hypothetical protein OAK97_01975 [bacterium]|nr:hypothetical protein [bacterium]
MGGSFCSNTITAHYPPIKWIMEVQEQLQTPRNDMTKGGFHDRHPTINDLMSMCFGAMKNPTPPSSAYFHAHFLARGFLLLCLGCLVSGCSSFGRDWKQTLSSPPVASSHALTGAWEGTWESDHNGHSGRLRCLVTHNPDGTFQTRYHARYAKVLSFTQDVTVKTEMTPEGHVFKGQQDLGRLAGGVYSYDGGVTNGTYRAQYRSKYDHGSFLMHRRPWQR